MFLPPSLLVKDEVIDLQKEDLGIDDALVQKIDCPGYSLNTLLQTLQDICVWVSATFCLRVDERIVFFCRA